MDGVDAALLEIAPGRLVLEGYVERPYPDRLYTALSRILEPDARVTLEELGRIDTAVGTAFASAALNLLEQTRISPNQIVAIGSHGQTVHHAPAAPYPFSMQVGNPAVIAALTGLNVVSDFRAMDVALGGQGAPLVPRFHLELFADPSASTAVLNIGGIANATLLPCSASASMVIAFDSGPGNTLMDFWANRHLGIPFDLDGAWAASGAVETGLLEFLLSDPYFSASPPKSTGREYFNGEWLLRALAASRETNARPENVQRTLLELTARTASAAIRSHLPECEKVVVCGGGARNQCLLARLATLMSPAKLLKSDELGVPANAVEAMAFAWLAHRRLHELPGNLPAATGASREAVLGSLIVA